MFCEDALFELSSQDISCAHFAADTSIATGFDIAAYFPDVSLNFRGVDGQTVTAVLPPSSYIYLG